MDYPEALDFLGRHINNAGVAGVEHGLSLEPMVELAALLGDPHLSYPVIHLTGTNGKGSTARMITRLLMEQGLSVGTYSSPHLEAYNERLQWNLEPVSNEDFAGLIGDVARVEPMLAEPPSHFDTLTAAAFKWFADIAVDVAVVEVGLLGRWDATNIVKSDVSVITNIGFDHTDGVGDWRSAVAGEKAGIIDAGSHVVLGETSPDLYPIFEAMEPETIWLRDRDFGLISNEMAVGGRLFSCRTPHGTFEDILLPVHGAHQGSNASLAVAAVEAFFGRAIGLDVVEHAFAELTLPGRFEVIQRSPLVILDGAHNRDGVIAARAVLDEEFAHEGGVILVTGMLAGRDTEAMLSGLGAGTAKLVITTHPNSSRSLAADELAKVAESLGATVEEVADMDQAMAYALAVATPDDVVFVSGSLYAVGEARATLTR